MTGFHPAVGTIFYLQSATNTMLLYPFSTNCSELITFRVIDDPDGDGIDGMIDTDNDNDGMPDTYEIANGFDPRNALDANEDSDNDGLTNLQEFLAGTDPTRADTDNDGISDADEIRQGTNPLIDEYPCSMMTCGLPMWLLILQAERSE